jgi:hypothetical protein
MPDTSGPYDGSPWAEADWYRSMAPTLPSGVHGTTPATSATTGSLGFAATGLTITPTAGRASVGGSGYVRTATLTSATASANAHATFSRRDRLVLRRSLSTHTVTLTIITGTPASSPVAPAITRDDTTWDLPLFSFLVPPASGTTISGVLDERVWIDPFRNTPRPMALNVVRQQLTGQPGDELLITDFTQGSPSVTGAVLAWDASRGGWSKNPGVPALLVTDLATSGTVAVGSSNAGAINARPGIPAHQPGLIRVISDGGIIIVNSGGNTAGYLQLAVGTSTGTPDLGPVGIQWRFHNSAVTQYATFHLDGTFYSDGSPKWFWIMAWNDATSTWGYIVSNANTQVWQL